MVGDADIAGVAALVADRARARILMALGDGRALPATVLASEAGVAASTASAHLGKLLDGGLLSVEQHGRHRYYRLASATVGEMIETLAGLAPTTEVRSLREGTASRQLRFARTCYDHVAGVLGVELMGALLSSEALIGGDGLFLAGRASDRGDRLSAPGSAVDYRLTEAGAERLSEFGIKLEGLPRRRPLIRYCVDWSEQRHHLAGALGAALATRLHELGWVCRAPRSRALTITDAGVDGFEKSFGLRVAELHG